MQILLQLKSAGLVVSTHSTQAVIGWPDPREVSVWDVISVVEGEGRTDRWSPISAETHVLAHVWEAAATASRNRLMDINFERLAEEVRGAAHDMYYI